MGEVVMGDGTVTGAGVILAQRVEQLAEPGSLRITAALHELLPNRMPFDLENIGEQTLKGCDDPVRVYRVELSPGASIPPPQQESQSKSSQKPWYLNAVIAVGVVVIGIRLASGGVMGNLFARIRIGVLLLLAGSLSGCDPTIWEILDELANVNPRIVGSAVWPGTCSSPSASDPPNFVYVDEPFAAEFVVEVPLRDDPFRLEISTGVDRVGAHGRLVEIPMGSAGRVTHCVDGLTLDWPLRAHLRAELFFLDEWESRFVREFDVLPRGRADLVFYSRYAHPAQRMGGAYRVGSQLRLETVAYVANGTTTQRSVGPTVSGSIVSGGGIASVPFSISLGTPITAPELAISELRSFTVTLDQSSAAGQKVFNDKAVMIGQASGTYSTPGASYNVLDWKSLKGIAADVIFIGDFTSQQKISAYAAITQTGGGYLQPARVTINRSLSKWHDASSLGMSPAQIDEFRDIADKNESAALAAFQPSKSIPRLTIYVVEGSFAFGWVGSYAGGGTSPVDANTPFRSPIIRYHNSPDEMAVTAGHEVGHAFGLSHTDGTSSCGDVHQGEPQEKFNLMFEYLATYSRLLSPCQRTKLASHGAFYVY